MSVIVYSKNACGKCVTAKSMLDLREIEYEERNISQNPTFMDEVMATGIMSMPVIVTDTTSPFNYSPAKFDEVFGEF